MTACGGSNTAHAFVCRQSLGPKPAQLPHMCQYTPGMPQLDQQRRGAYPRVKSSLASGARLAGRRLSMSAAGDGCTKVRAFQAAGGSNKTTHCRVRDRLGTS